MSTKKIVFKSENNTYEIVAGIRVGDMDYMVILWAYSVNPNTYDIYYIQSNKWRKLVVNQTKLYKW